MGGSAEASSSEAEAMTASDIDHFLVSYWRDGSVCGLRPREAMSIRITEGSNGWFVGAYTGDGSKPGSLLYASGGFDTPEDAFAYIMKDIRRGNP